MTVEALPEPTDQALSHLAPGQRFEKTWQLRNAGSQPWGDDAELRLTDPAGLRAPSSLRLPNAQPGESIALRMGCVAPDAPGVYQSHWRVAANGVVSDTLYLPIIVRGDDSYPTLTPTITATPTLTPWRPGTCIVESPHPYTSSDDGEWIITNPDPNAYRTALHISRLELAAWDKLYLYQGEASNYFDYYAAVHNGLDIWTESCEGRVIRVKLSVLLGHDDWGFCIDNIGTVARPTATPTPTPCPSYCSCDTFRPCSCNPSYCTCNRICTCNLVYYEQ